MIALTTTAREKLKEYLEAEPAGTVVRILVDAERGEFGLALDAPEPEDEAFTVDGIPFSVERRYVPALEGLEIGYESKEGAAGFSLTGGRRLVKHAPIALRRDCEAVAIPAGNKVELAAGTKVTVTQALGGNATVLVLDQGILVRVAAKDADALGAVAEVPSNEAAPSGPLEELVLGQLKKVYDPEIPVNIADLGLVYGCEITDRSGGGKKVEIRMTLTAPGCGMGETLRREVAERVGGLPGVKEVHVELVFEPEWNRSMMSEAAKLELGMI